jgi:hypothetical protein
MTAPGKPVEAELVLGVRWLTAAAGLVGAGLFAWYWASGRYDDWGWWQYLVGMLLAYQVCAAAVAGTVGAGGSRLAGVLRNPVAYAALQVQPFLILWLYPHGRLGWACAWYAAAVLGVAAVAVAPPHLRRPLAMLVFVAAAAFDSVNHSPRGWDWFPLVYLVGLVLARAMAEGPYRWRPST